MAKNCGPGKGSCGMPHGLFNPFFTGNYANPYYYSAGEALTIGDVAAVFLAADVEASNAGPAGPLGSPMSYWVNGKTLIPFMRSHTAPYNQGLSIITYDAGYGVLRPYEIGPSVSVSDTHSTPTITVAPNGRIYVTQVRPQSVPARIYKSRANNDPSTWEMLSETLGDEIAYVSLTPVGDNYSAWTRFMSPGPIYPTAIYLSSNGMESWGTRLNVTAAPTAGTRHYNTRPFRNFADGWYYYEVTLRIDTGTIWRSKYILKTQDHTTFYNYQGSFSKNVSVSGAISIAELNTNFRYYDTGSDANQASIPISSVSPEGGFFSVTTDGAGAYRFVYYSGGWQSKAINITSMVDGAAIGGDGQNGPFSVLISNSNTEHLLFVRRDVTVGAGTYAHYFIYKTVDTGDTWTEVGDLTPDVEQDFYRIIFPGNFDDITGKFAIGLVTATNPSPIYIVTMSFDGPVSADTQTLNTTPVSSLTDVANLVRHYKVSAATVTKTGTTLNSLVDQSASAQNATTEGSPVLDSGTTPTYVTFDGTNDAATVPTTGLTALAQMTLIAVVRKTNASTGDAGLVMCAANTTNANRYVICGIDKRALYQTSIKVQYRNDHATTDFAFFGDEVAIHDTNFEILTWIIDGSNYQMYINGRKQMFHASDEDARELTGSCFDNITGGVSNIIISALKRTTNSFSGLDLKEWALWSRAISESERRSIEKKLSVDHSITLSNEYE